MLSPEKFEHELSKQGVSTNDQFLIAVSGGVDSMALWQLFHQLDLNYAIAHVNFCLRGEASNKDMDLVVEIAKERKVSAYCKSVDTTTYAKKHRLSIQMAARAIRYEWFEELRSKYAFKHIVTAHHLDDSVETFFINLNRGTGLKGLRGISSKKGLVRPLLSFSKGEILNYARKNKIIFREDQSNSELTYERNWFRHEIIKPWKERNPGFLFSMKQTMDHLRKVQNQYEDYLEEESQRLGEEVKEGFLSIQCILQLKEPQQILYHLLEPYELTFDQIEQLFESIKNRRVGKQFLTASYRLTLDREKVFIERHSEDVVGEEVKIHADTKVINEPILMQFEDIIGPVDLIKNKNVEYVDKKRLKYPLEVRPWEEGDRMIPLGMKGKKKISDILVDEKIPLKDKKNYWLLCSGNEVVWLIGLRLDDRFKLTKNADKILKIVWEKKE